MTFSNASHMSDLKCLVLAIAAIIKGKSPKMGVPWPIAMPTFSNQGSIPNLKSLALAIAKVIKENPKFWGVP